jgi:hypothetical protein
LRLLILLDCILWLRIVVCRSAPRCAALHSSLEIGLSNETLIILICFLLVIDALRVLEIVVKIVSLKHWYLDRVYPGYGNS